MNKLTFRVDIANVTFDGNHVTLATFPYKLLSYLSFHTNKCTYIADITLTRDIIFKISLNKSKLLRGTSNQAC